MSAPAEHPFLEARHVDDLTDAIRSLTRTIAAASNNHRELMDATRAVAEILRDIRRTADTMLELARAGANGAAL